MKSQRSKQYKKQRKTKRRYNGGMRPTKEQLSHENKILKTLCERFYDDKSRITATEAENVFTTLSPYATYKKNKNLLLTFLREFAGNHYDTNFNKQIINNLVTRTIAENDPTLVTDDVVLAVLTILLSETSSRHKMLNDEIRFILTELPIKNQKLLLKFYKEVIEHDNLEVLHILIETHNVLTNKTEYNNLIRYINGCIREVSEEDTEDNSDYENDASEDMAYYKEVKKIVETINPSKLRTVNVLYSAQERGIELPPDVVTELHKYNKMP